jgi:hypothetical protein
MRLPVDEPRPDVTGRAGSAAVAKSNGPEGRYPGEGDLVRAGSAADGHREITLVGIIQQGESPAGFRQ